MSGNVFVAGAGQALGALCGGGGGGGGGAQYAAIAPKPQTLISALSEVEALNKRLCELSANAHELATAIGGPSPVAGTSSGKNAETNQGAIQRLNAGIAEAYTTIASVESAIAAMRRSLGA